MFDINGDDKLSMESVEAREAIVKHYAADPRSVFFISTSGGKDSDIMAITVRKLVPEDQIVYVHAHLGELVEHPGILEHINKYKPASVPLKIVKNERKDFVDMVLLRGMFPSAQYRQCTSDLKTNEIDKFVRAEMKRRGATVGFNCIGLRSYESVPRSKRSPLFINKRLTLKSGQRTVYDWLPVFHYTEDDVFQGIVDAGQKPFHVYGVDDINGVATRVFEGNSRVSCRYCIMGSKNDLVNGANWYPDSYAMMVALERVVEHTMFTKSVANPEYVKVEVVKDGKKKIAKRLTIPMPLTEKTGVQVDEVAVEKWMTKLEARRAQLIDAKNAELEAKALRKKETLVSVKNVDTQTYSMVF
jgi:3'-phosphoadenosine 5'-phosphosulfate sulfotransferase (PAPS reductase)/FAD synthetase